MTDDRKHELLQLWGRIERTRPAYNVSPMFRSVKSAHHYDPGELLEAGASQIAARVTKRWKSMKNFSERRALQLHYCSGLHTAACAKAMNQNKRVFLDIVASARRNIDLEGVDVLDKRSTKEECVL